MARKKIPGSRPVPDRAAPQESGPGVPQSKPPDLASSDDSSRLAAVKARLEVRKLRGEVRAARESRTWWRRSVRDVKLSEWFTVCVAVAALSAEWATGLFSTTRE